MITTPKAIVINIENFGINDSAKISFFLLSRFEIVGSNVNPKKITPPIQIAATRL